MNLKKKKKLAARVLGVGLARVMLVSPEEIKEAITRQDIIDLKKSGAIRIKEIKGKSRIIKRKTRRRMGSRKTKIKTERKDYIKLTRKLRDYVKNLKGRKEINKKEYYNLRKNIRTKSFKSISNLIGTVKGKK